MQITRKAFRILVTEKCNLRCRYCFNKNIRRNIDISINDFVLICKLLANEGNIKLIKLMGGEPTLHSDFQILTKIAKDYFPHIYIFTNAFNNVIESIKLRYSDAIVYNLSCLPLSIRPSKLVPDQECSHIFEVRIDAHTKVDRIKTKLINIYNVLGPRMVVNLTLNCVENIFSLQNSIIQIWNEIAIFCRHKLAIVINLDHDAPLCFVSNTKIILDRYNPFCFEACAGLITPDLYLRFCNQTDTNLVKIKNDFNLISYDVINELLSKEFLKKISYNKNNFCRDCKFFPNKCNGGCFAHRF